MKNLLLLCIRAYRRFLSPWLPPSCRHVPSCSVYAEFALRRHGIWRGLRMTVRRLLRCQPWSAGGYDPVP